MSSIERYSRTIPVSGVIELGIGNVLLLISATGVVNVRLENGGAAEGVSGVLGGVRIERIKPWMNARILGTAGVTVEFWIGSQAVDRDFIDVFTQITTIAGVAVFSENPSVALVTPADIPIAAATTDVASIPQNLLRRRITVGVIASANGPVRVSAAGLTLRGIEIQPGTNQQFNTTAALGIRNDDAVLATSFYYFEES